MSPASMAGLIRGITSQKGFYETSSSQPARITSESRPTLNMPSRSYSVTQLTPSASFAEALKTHWREYLMEAAELGVLMFCICLSASLLYSSASPVKSLSLSSTTKGFLMGVLTAIATCLIIRSPFGRRSGAHFNPAITLTYFFLDRVHRWDALHYMAAQFAGAMVGVFIAHEILGERLAAVPVCYVITTPGGYGNLIAFVAEFSLAGLLMGVVLFATNHRALGRFSPFIVALVTVFYYAFCPSLSGFSVNPARSFSSAIFAMIWQGIWIYFVAPCLGMLAAASMYVRIEGRQKVYCAKVFHDLHSICPFPCHFYQLYREAESTSTEASQRPRS
jgi:aquaporin Z